MASSPGLTLSSSSSSSLQDGDGPRLQVSPEQRAQSIHRLDTLVLLMFVSLLVAIVLTAWFMKHKRFRFVHESGLTLFYGLMIGGVLRFTNLGQIESQTLDVIARNNSALNQNEPPQYLRLGVTQEDKPVQFHYEIQEGFFADAKQHDEKQIEQKTTFSPEVFFNMLLPPIIFNAGYSLKKQHFFRNIGSIMTFVFVGTTISCVLTGVLMYIGTKIFWFAFSSTFSFQELLFFGALLAATDPIAVLSVFSEMRVESDLYALIFGESVLNDAVAMVLASTIDQYSSSSATVFDLKALIDAFLQFFTIFFGSLILGAVVGCSNALITKFTRISDFAILETALFILISYISFLLAEVIGLTGIVAVLFCGICQAHYTFNNLSEESQHRTKQFFEMIYFLSESFIFVYIGVSVVTTNSGKWNLIFLLASMAAIFVSRAAFVYPLCGLLNIWRRPRISKNYQHMLVFAGLRGAMAFALACRNTSTEQRQIMSTTTSMIVIITVFVNGGLTAWMIDFLRIKHGSMLNSTESQTQIVLEENGGLDGENHRSSSDRAEATISGLNPWDKAFLPRKWYNFDASFMKPLLTHANPTLIETLPSICLPLAKILTSSRQMTVYVSHDDESITSSDREERIRNSNPFAMGHPM